MSAAEAILARWDRVVQEVKTKMRGLVDALNTRTFTLDNLTVCEIYDPGFQVDRSPWLPSRGITSLKDYVNQIQDMNSHYPNWSLQNATLKDIIYIDETHTNCISSIELHNVPDGIIRQIMTLFRFHLKDGKWMIFTTEAMTGFEPDEGSEVVTGPLPPP